MLQKKVAVILLQAGFLLLLASTNVAAQPTVAVGAYLQTDARFYAGAEVPDAFLLRRARVKFSAVVNPRVRVVIEPDFGEGRVALADGWAEARLGSALYARAGRFKTPFGLEVLHSSRALWFIERAFPTALSPQRDIGVMLHGVWNTGRLEGAIGVFNGAIDGSSSAQEQGQAKDVAVRLWGRPLAGLGVGLAVTHGSEQGTLRAPALAVYEAPGDIELFRFAEGVVAAGRRTRISPQARLDAGAVGAMLEYIVTQEEVLAAGRAFGVTNRGWQIAAVGAVPGRAGLQRDKPFGEGRGPVELSVRVHRIVLDKAAVSVAGAETRTRTATAWATALHWYPAVGTRLGLHVERTLRGAVEGVAQDPITFVGARFQVSF